MIYRGPLTEKQRRDSQWNYIGYSVVNGISYTCLGDMVMVLLAVRLQLPDWCIAALNATVFCGFILMPLGKLTTARIGAAKSQALFWVARNIAALGVASSIVWWQWNIRAIIMPLILTGVFIFYGCRAAGVVMSVPLVGNITTSQERGKLLGRSNCAFFALGAVMLLVLSYVLKWNRCFLNDSIWTLFGIIAFGALCGVGASGFLNRIDETEDIRQFAAKPLWKDISGIWRNRDIMKMLLSRICTAFGCAITIIGSMLFLKRGYGVSDSGALLYALVMYVGNAVWAILCARLAQRTSPRFAVVVAYAFSVLVTLLWLVAPQKFCAPLVVLIFFLQGGTNIAKESVQALYFLQCVPEAKQTSVSVLVSLFDGAFVGILAMVISAILLKCCDGMVTPDSPAILKYRYYFLFTLPVLLFGFWGAKCIREFNKK